MKNWLGKVINDKNVVAGLIEVTRARKQFPAYSEAKGEAGLLQLDAIAETYSESINNIQAPGFKAI